MALILATMRNLIKANNFSRDGLWKDGPFPFGTSMAGKTLGIAGLGRIGSAIALRAEPFKVNIAYHNRQLKHVPYTFCESLEDLAEISDILVCVLPGGAETDNLINANVLKKLGPSGIFINVGRGNSVDDEALIEALNSGAIQAAGLDVYKNEPQIPDAYKILDNVNEALQNNFKEIVLTGVDLTSWGKELLAEEYSLGFLVKKILNEFKNLPRLRVSSIDPAEIDYKLTSIKL